MWGWGGGASKLLGKGCWGRSAPHSLDLDCVRAHYRAAGSPCLRDPILNVHTCTGWDGVPLSAELMEQAEPRNPFGHSNNFSPP